MYEAIHESLCKHSFLIRKQPPTQLISLSKYSDRHPVSREVLKFMFWKVPMAVWQHLWLATAQAEPQNFSQQT